MKDKKGFTLIEMLVVVLIIGVLAAIALPQYKKAVTKSKAAKMQTLLAQFIQSMERYYLVEGKYPSSFDDLDINTSLPISNGQNKDLTCGINMVSHSVMHGDDFEIALYDFGIWKQYSMAAFFTKGKHKCRGFVYFFNDDDYNGSIYCGEHRNNRSCGDGCEPGIFCQDVLGKSYVAAQKLIALYK